MDASRQLMFDSCQPVHVNMRRQVSVPVKSGGTFTLSENRSSRRRNQQRWLSVTIPDVNVRLGDATVKPVAVDAIRLAGKIQQTFIKQTGFFCGGTQKNQRNEWEDNFFSLKKCHT